MNACAYLTRHAGGNSAGTYNLKYAKGFLSTANTTTTARTTTTWRSKAQTTFYFLFEFFGVSLFFVCKLLQAACCCCSQGPLIRNRNNERSRSGSRSSSGCGSTAPASAPISLALPFAVAFADAVTMRCLQYTVNRGHDKETSLEAFFVLIKNPTWRACRFSFRLCLVNRKVWKEAWESVLNTHILQRSI